MNMDEEKIRTLPLLALKNSVLFPGLLMPLGVGRKASVAAVESALATEDKEVIVVAQKDPTVETPGADDLYTIGTRAVIRKSGRPRPDHIDLFVQGIERVVIVKVEENGHLKAKIRPLPLPDDSSRELEALSLSVVETASKYVNLVQGGPAQEIAQAFAAQSDPLQLAFLIASVMNLDVEKEQSLLETSTRIEALRMVLGWMSHEVDVAELRAKVTEKAKSEMTREQREYVLRQQKKAIEQELGEGGTDAADAQNLRDRVEKAELPEEILKEANRELDRLEKINSASPEHNVIRTWLEYVIELPWTKRSEDNLDLKRAREVLDEDHYGIAKVKERIVEQLAVLKLNPEAKAPILCFVGAPGVGKTSLGQSIARALGRKFERMSLGGLHDEAELRGHRRTYIGALPGRLIQAMRRAGFANPVLMLDEVDKLGRDFRGDPAAALLEILDPEQNKTFRDNYLDMAFDLSKVMFVTTANTLDTIPAPLLDRMEIIRLSGYSEEEKLEIARRYLWPRRLKEAGLEGQQVQLPEDVLDQIISRYTREAGVRQLEQMLGRLTRKVALTVAERSEGQDPGTVVIRKDDLSEWLGSERFMPEEARKNIPIGVA